MLLRNIEGEIQNTCISHTISQQKRQNGTRLVFAHFVLYIMHKMQDYVMKINNTVWTCCILHNLLLSYDGELCVDCNFISIHEFLT